MSTNDTPQGRVDNQPACPMETTAQIEGTATAANVTGPANQGIDPGDFADAVEAILTGQTYANVHSTLFPNGEIRGQVRVGLKVLEDAAPSAPAQ